MLKLRHAALIALGLSATAVLRAQTVWTVGPGQQFATIQQGINAASNGDEVLVSPGTYVENIDFKGKGISVANGGTTLGIAIIDGSGAGPVVTIIGATGAFLHGFTIQNGGKPQATNGPQGGIYIANSTATIANNTLVKNFCAGINATGSNVNVLENDISQTITTGCGAAEGLGSGVAITSYLTTAPNPNGNPTAFILQNTIHNNIASVASTDRGGGGALNITNVAFASVDYNKMYANVTTGYGGAFYLAGTTQLLFNNNLVYGNKGVSGGLDIVFPNQNVGPLLGVLSNNTIADNTATTTGTNAGSDIYISGNLGRYALVNNIVVGYTNNQVAVNCGTAYQSQTVTPLIVDHNDFYSVSGSGNTPIGGFCTAANAPAQLGNISKDPLFVHGTAADIAGTSGNAVDLSLQAASPAIDTGNNSGNTLPGDTQNASALDIANKPRLANGGNGGLSYPVVDMGAYEYQPASSTNPIVDTVLSLAPSSFTPASGGNITLTATISSNTSNGLTQTSTAPTGSINFLEDYTVVGSGVITANGNSGTAAFTLTNLAAGIHHLQAVYTGQSAFPPGISVDIIISATVGITTQTVTTIVSSLNPSSPGQLVTFTGNVSSSNGVPDGQMIFSLDTNSTLCAAQAVDASGNATCSTSALTLGSHIITATFIPNGTAFSSSSASLTQLVAVPSATTLTSSVNPAVVSQTVTLTAVVTSTATPTGTVAFYDTSNGLPLGTQTLSATTSTTATATLNASFIAVGPHNLTATYLPTGAFTGSVGTLIQNVDYATTTTLLSTPNPSTLGQSVTFTSTVSTNLPGLVATGSVNFYDGTTLLANEPFQSGTSNAIFTTSTLTVGSHNITATYAPDKPNFAVTSASVVQVVGYATTTKLTSSLNPSNYTQSVTFTAVVATGTSGTPTGAVAFYDGGSLLVTQPFTTASLNSAIAQFTTTTLPVGDDAITAVYMPTGNFATSTGALTQVVIGATTTKLTSSLNPSGFGQLVTFTAQVSPVNSSGTGGISGSVSFYDGSTLLATKAFAMGTDSGCGCLPAIFSISTLSIGSHPITAIYNPNSYLASSSDSLTQVVVGITDVAMSLSSNLNPSLVTQPVTFTATLSSIDPINGIPTGSVTFTDSTTGISYGTQPLLNGVAAVTVSTLAPGMHTINAVYVPTVSYGQASASLMQVVNLVDTATSLSYSPNPPSPAAPVTVTATITPAATIVPPITGTVLFYVDNVALGSVNVVGNSAVLVLPSLAVGQHTISCIYLGEGDYKGSSCGTANVTVTILPTTLTVTSGTNPSPAVTPVTFTAQLLTGTTPVAGATVTINATGLSPQSGILSGPTTGITNAQGIATVTYAGFYPGAYGIKATYAGDAIHAAAASTTIPETVFINPTTMTLIAAPNPAPEGTAVTLAVDVAATTTTTPPPGTVTILDGGTPLITLPLTLNGALSSASFTTSSLVAGTHNLTATYTPTVLPDPPFQPTQTTAALALVITPLSFDLSTDKPTISIQTEHHGAMTLTVTPVGNYVGTVTLACTGTLPPVLQCEFAKNQLLVSNAAASTTLTLETDAVPNFWGSLAPQRERTTHREEFALATLLPLALLGLTRKRRKLARVVLLSTLFALLSVSLTGCGDKWPDHTPPGTYDVAITATGNANQRAITKTIHVTLTVTP